MKEEIESLIPLIKMGKVSGSEIQDITDRIRKSIREDASKGKELGELLSRINRASKAKSHHTQVNWVAVQKGFLAIGHKPGGKISFESLKTEGTTAVLTLLNDNEGASSIGKQLTTVNIDWIWFPFSASKPHDEETIDRINNLYAQLANLVNAGAKIYIHCSAGIHRTGMITYGFLRFLGHDTKEAFKQLQLLREVTAAQVGNDRLLWADQFGSNNHLKDTIL